MSKQVPPPELEERIKRALPYTGRSPSRTPWILAVAAALLIAVGLWQGSVHRARQSRIDAILSLGVDDHVACAVAANYSKDRPNPQVMRGQVGSTYAALVSLVMRQAPDYELLDAHHCQAGGRGFVHFILEKQGALLSVVVTRKIEGERFPADAANLESTKMQKLAVTGFETRHDFVMVVSSPDNKEHKRIAEGLFPEVRQALGNLPARLESSGGSEWLVKTAVRSSPGLDRQPAAIASN